MRTILWIGIGPVSLFLLAVSGVIIYALPATASLDRGTRPGIDEITIDDAALHLAKAGYKGHDLIEQARLIVGERMAYCRRNSFDSYERAFARGYGYCQQEAYALAALLQELGFDAWPVHCEHCDFSDTKDTGHAWVQVLYEGKVLNIDSTYMDTQTGKLLFTAQGPVKAYTSLFRLFSGWGSTAANARRYYKTGSDTDTSY
jgi:hypothetical protein